MKHITKAKIMLEAAVAVAVALVLIMPGAAVNANDQNKYAFPNSNPMAIANVQRMQPMGTTMVGSDVLLSFAAGDDVLPHVTLDPEGNVVVTWTNEPNVAEGSMGIVFSSNPTEPTSWDGWIISLSDPFSYWFDTAKVVGPDPGDFSGLMGIYMTIDTELAGYYLIDDITADPSLWEFYTWTNGAPEPQYACIADMGFYQDLYYPEFWGPFNFYIYHEIYASYDIVDCPICFHTDVRGGAGGVGFFDGQSFEKTAPASDPDLVDLGDRFHTIIQYNNATEGAQLVWKKIVPSEEPDYEFTAYQATLGPGEAPAIAAYDTNVAIVYMDGGQVKCMYSSDDGDTFTDITIAAGGYPDICAVDTTFYATYIDSGNLFLIESSDGGATWSAPEQVNDVDGTVVEEINSVDIHEGGIVWMDTQNADIDIYYDELVELNPPADIEIGTISGGIGVTAEIKNVGAADATDVDWSITLDGGFIILGKEASGTIASIPAGGSTSVSTGLVFGIGKPTITVTAATDSVETSAFVLLFLVLGL